MNRVLLVVCLLAGAPIPHVHGYNVYVTLTNDGPSIQGGRITFKADLFEENGRRPSGTFSYKWKDNALIPHEYESPATSNTTSYWTVDYPADTFPVGVYTTQVIVSQKIILFWSQITSSRGNFLITSLLNGNMTIIQKNNTLSEYVASDTDTKINIKLRSGDDFYIKNNSSGASTYWFVNCKYYGSTENFIFPYKFAKPDETYTVEALVIVSHEPPANTTVAPTTTTTATTTTTTTMTTTVSPSIVKNNSELFNNSAFVHSTSGPVVRNANLSAITSTDLNTIAPTIAVNNSAINLKQSGAITKINENGEILGNFSFPYVCLNSSVIPPDPKKTYGYFYRRVKARASISNITVEGTNWIQPWDMLSLKVACHGSGPFTKCVKFYRGEYNVTGNETCDEGENLSTCNFSISHYFLEPSVNTILVILDNEVSRLIYPVTINIYKSTTKPQLSVIVVPVSCSLVAVVLIIFGVAYYIQSRARFTIEVADFDFGQNNPEMEYKTFTERLRDSVNNTGYKPLSNPESTTSAGQ